MDLFLFELVGRKFAVVLPSFKLRVAGVWSSVEHCITVV